MARSKEAVLGELRELVAEQLDVSEEEVTPESKFEDDLGADSLDVVEIAMAVEDKYGFNIRDEEQDNFKTFGDLVQFVAARV